TDIAMARRPGRAARCRARTRALDRPRRGTPPHRAATAPLHEVDSGRPATRAPRRSPGGADAPGGRAPSQIDPAPDPVMIRTRYLLGGSASPGNMRLPACPEPDGISRSGYERPIPSSGRSIPLVPGPRDAIETHLVSPRAHQGSALGTGGHRW